MSYEAETVIFNSGNGNNPLAVVDEVRKSDFWRVESHKSNANDFDVLLLVDTTPTYQRLTTISPGESVSSNDFPDLYDDVFLQAVGTVAADQEIDVYELNTL